MAGVFITIAVEYAVDLAVDYFPLGNVLCNFCRYSWDIDGGYSSGLAYSVTSILGKVKLNLGMGQILGDVISCLLFSSLHLFISLFSWQSVATYFPDVRPP